MTKKTIPKSRQRVVAKSGMRQGGAPEILTRELAQKIVALIENLADTEQPLTWDNICTQVNRRFKTNLQRDVLSTKSWDGRKIIREAKDEAKSIERRLQNQQGLKYANSSRAALRKRISDLEAKVLALKDELDKARAAQIDKLDTFRLTRMDLRQLVEAV